MPARCSGGALAADSDVADHLNKSYPRRHNEEVAYVCS